MNYDRLSRNVSGKEVSRNYKMKKYSYHNEMANYNDFQIAYDEFRLFRLQDNVVNKIKET